jgi:D-alanyl-D-alanine carboxypeptidase/D-alanyl-D-alanine-endopeptidase (penicillin-binding protein 4)
MNKVLTIIGLLAGVPLIAVAEDAPLPHSVQSAMNVRQLPESSLSIYVADLGSGETLLELNADVARNPASTIKLLTTLVALDVLGPAYRWHTDIYALGEVEDGHLLGDLLIRGTGDPFLVTERVWQMLRELRQAGIHEIDGDLLLDDSFFAVPDEDPAAFDRQPLRAYNVAPNALMMNFKVVRYWFEPNHDANTVRVWLDPPLQNVDVDNQLSLKSGRCAGFQRGITISANDAIDKMTFSGKFPSGCDYYAMDRTVLGHNEFAFGLVMSLWRESGGVFAGDWKNSIAPEDVEPDIEFRSMPLADIITRVNKYSNNVMARHLLYTLSAEVLGAPGTEAGGRQVVEDWLQENGVLHSELAFDNGAGLSRNSRLAARDLGSMLEFGWRQSYMPEYVSSLSISGMDGTLSRRFRDLKLAGKAHMKTGSMDDVAALAGYLQTRSGRRLSVVVIQNHKDVHRGPGEEVQEAVIRWLYEQ